jgi:hypothetical protein
MQAKKYTAGAYLEDLEKGVALVLRVGMRKKSEEVAWDLVVAKEPHELYGRSGRETPMRGSQAAFFHLVRQ